MGMVAFGTTYPNHCKQYYSYYYKYYILFLLRTFRQGGMVAFGTTSPNRFL